jgi:acyl carrier protein/nodulation protein F
MASRLDALEQIIRSDGDFGFMSDVAIDVIAIITKKKRVEKPTVESTDWLEDLGLESLDAVEMIFDEEKFDIQIPYNANTDNPHSEFQTVGDVVKSVKNLVAQKEA